METSYHNAAHKKHSQSLYKLQKLVLYRPWRNGQFMQKKCKTMSLTAVLNFYNPILISLGHEKCFRITSMDHVGQIFCLVNRF